MITIDLANYSQRGWVQLVCGLVGRTTKRLYLYLYDVLAVSCISAFGLAMLPTVLLAWLVFVASAAFVIGASALFSMIRLIAYATYVTSGALWFRRGDKAAYVLVKSYLLHEWKWLYLELRRVVPWLSDFPNKPPRFVAI